MLFTLVADRLILCELETARFEVKLFVYLSFIMHVGPVIAE